MPVDLNILGSLNGPTQATASGNTAFAAFIPPWPGPAGANILIQRAAPSPVFMSEAITHITKICYTTGGTAHLLTLMRPLNYAVFTKAFPKNTTLLDTYLSGDPGVYTTNYLYNGGSYNGGVYGGVVGPAQVADAAISSTNKYVAYQCADGTWVMDTITSGTYGSSLTLTTGTPNRTNGQVLAGSPFYYFGAVTLKDPFTGQLNPQTTVAASLTRDVITQDTNFGLWQALHPGDPMILYSANGTNAGTLEYVSGFYAKV